MRRFRDWLLKAASCGTPEVDLEACLDIKFANAQEAELDTGETVLIQLFQPPRQIRSRNWLLPHRHWGAGDLLALTVGRMLWITDRERGYRSPYGSIASYAPPDAVLRIGPISNRAGHTLQVELTSGSGWQVPIEFGSRRECQQVADDFAAALEIQKRRHEASQTEVRL
jgi:hypothetical protein